MTKKTIAAYGLELEIFKNELRPDIDIITRGLIKDFELRFYDVATLYKALGARTPAVIFEIMYYEEDYLDKIMLVNLGLRMKQNVYVELETGNVIQALTYITNQFLPTDDAFYKARIEAIYMQYQLDLKYLEKCFESSGL